MEALNPGRISTFVLWVRSTMVWVRNIEALTMFERYTDKARRVISFARYVASNYGSPYIETEHLATRADTRNFRSHVLPPAISHFDQQDPQAN